MPGFPGVVLIPLGRLPTSPIPLLARVALWFHHPHRRAGHIHARCLSESIESVAIARQACGYAQRCGNNTSGIQERWRGSGGGLRFIAYSHGKSSWGTHRAALGGTLTARELLVGGSGFHVGLSFYYPLRCRASVAVFPLVLRARRVAWSERFRPCHWRLAMPGFPGAVLIPLGRLQTFPILLLARGPLWFHHLHLRAGHIHARRISESIEAVAIA